MPRLKSRYYECPTPPEERGREALLRFIDRNTGKNLKFTKAALAEKIGITPVAFSSKMTGKTRFSLKDVSRIIDALDASDEEVLSFLGRVSQKSKGK